MSVRVCVRECVCAYVCAFCLFMKRSVNVFRCTTVYVRAYAREDLHACVSEVHSHCVRRPYNLLFDSSALSIKLPPPSQCKQVIITP